MKSKASHERAIVNCDYCVSAFSTSERRVQNKDSKLNKEAALIIKQTFESVIQTELFPSSEINIFIQVIQSDGGDRAAAINATTLALSNAGIPMQDFVMACTAGFVDNTPLLDLNHTEKLASCD